MDKTLKDYINRSMEELKQEQKPKTPVPEFNDYEVYPEDDGTDSKRNAYSRV